MSSTADRIEEESHKDPQRLEREIDQQRADIGNIVDALENKLSPGQMFDRMLDFGKGNGLEFAQSLGNAVKANPVPTLLASVGLLWLYASRNDPAPAPAGSMGTGMGRSTFVQTSSPDDGSGMLDRARDIGSNVSDTVSSTLDQAKARVGDMSDTVSNTLQHAKSRVTETAQNARDTVQQQSQRVVQGFNGLLRDNPLALGAIGIAVGALLGAALPSTEPENRLMGEASDTLTDKAKQAVSTGADKVRSAVHEMGEPDAGVRH